MHYHELIMNSIYELCRLGYFVHSGKKINTFCNEQIICSAINNIVKLMILLHVCLLFTLYNLRKINGNNFPSKLN